MRKKVLLITIVCIMILSLVSCSKTYHTIVVFDTFGKVILERGRRTIKAFKDMMLKSEDKVILDNDGFARLCFDDEIFAYMESNTEAEVISNHRKRLSVNVSKGEMIVEVTKKLDNGEGFSVHTPNTNMGIRGTVVAVKCILEENGNMMSINYVLEGNAELVLSDGEVILLDAGEGWGVTSDSEGNIIDSKKAGSEQFDFDNVDVTALKGADDSEMLLITADVSKTDYNPVDVLFCVDRSASMYLKGFASLERRIVHYFINAADKERDMLAIQSYTTTVENNCPFTTDKSLLRDAIDSIKPDAGVDYYSGTDGTNALHTAIDELISTERENERIAVFFSDGLETTSSYLYSEIADYAIENDVTVYTIGIGITKSEDLSRIAEKTGGYSYYINGDTSVYFVCEDILAHIRANKSQSDITTGED